VYLIIYADHVETPLARLGDMTQIVPRHRSQLSLLPAIHGGFRGFDVMRGSCFDFYKTEDIVVPPDQVDFSPATRGAIVACDNYLTSLP